MAEPLDMQARVDPWQDVRAREVGCILTRIIDLARGVQHWQRFERTPANLEVGAELWDGATIVMPTIPGGRSVPELDAIIAEYDAAYTPMQDPA